MKPAWTDLPLRTRLVIVYLVLLLLSGMVLSAYSYLDVRRLLIYNTAARLRAQAKPVIENMLQKRLAKATSATGHTKPLVPADDAILAQIAGPLACDLTSRDTAALILDSGGRELASCKRLSEEPTPVPPQPRYYRLALAGNNEVDYQLKINGSSVLVLLIPLRPKPGSGPILGVAQLSTSLDHIQNILWKHGVVMAVVAAVVLLVGGGAGWLLITSAFGVLNRMVDTCRSIAQGDLGQRVNLPQRHDEIGRLATAFDEMVARIEAIVEAERRFVGNAAHELRTPLTALRGSMEVLMRGAQDDPAMVSRLTQNMHREVVRLSRLCEQLLNLSRLDMSQTVQKRTINLVAFMDDFLPQARNLAKGRRVVLRRGPLVHLTVDADLLKQVLFNLVDNAVKHTDIRGEIILGWQLRTGTVEFFVVDDGEGIAPRDLPHVFEPFFRGRRAASNGEPGAGLGLALVAAVIKAHNGQISVESEPGAGARFVFNVPLDS